MKTTGDLWEIMGGLDADDLPHVLTRLFVAYERQLQLNPEDTMAKEFFCQLERAMDQVTQCNLNRR